MRAEGQGLEYGQVGQKQAFNIYVGDAGGGELKASINGPAKAHITLTDYEVCPICSTPIMPIFKDGACRAEYSTDEPGLYTISLLLDDAPISGSPFKVFIAPASSHSTTSSPATKKPYKNGSGRQAPVSEKSNSFSYEPSNHSDSNYEEAARMHQNALNELHQQENQPVIIFFISKILAYI